MIDLVTNQTGAAVDHKYDAFISYASEDIAAAQSMFLALRRSGVRVWMDKPPRPFELEGLLPGQDWNDALHAAISSSAHFIPLFSPASVNKRGYVHKEFRAALDKAAEMPHGAIFIVPIRLAPCEVPKYEISGIRFEQYQRLDCFDNDFSSLVKFLEARTLFGVRAKDGLVKPANAEEFLDSFEGGNDIVITNDIDLSDVTRRKRKRVLIDDTFDGFEVVVRDFENARIGSQSTIAEITVPFAYSNVLVFENCKGLVIRNLKFGHAVEKGTCVGGVIVLRACQEIHFSRCDFHGCGAQAIELERCKNITITDCNVQDCTYGIAKLKKSEEVLFERVQFKNNEKFFGIEMTRCNDVIFRDCGFVNNHADGPLIEPFGCGQVSLIGCEFQANFARALVPREDKEIVIKDCDFVGNAWQE